jgi:hypothetical protein
LNIYLFLRCLLIITGILVALVKVNRFHVAPLTETKMRYLLSIASIKERNAGPGIAGNKKKLKENAIMSLKGRTFITSLILGGLLVSGAARPSAMEGPDMIELDALTNIYNAVTFDHAMHADMASCATCHHHTTGLPAEDVRCVGCHGASAQTDEVGCTGCHTTSPGSAKKMKESQATNLFHTDTTGLKRAYHLQCLGCHKEMEAASGCEDCHAKKDINLKVSQDDDSLKTSYTR